MDRYLYDTFIKMKQGIGRLIRCETDHGKVVVLDSRFHRIKDKFIKQNKNKPNAFREIDAQKAQQQTMLDAQVSNLQNDQYIYHYGTCGEEIRADANECPSCKQKFKQCGKPLYQTPNRDLLEFQNESACEIQEELPVAIEHIIEDENKEDALLEASNQTAFVQNDFGSHPISKNMNAKHEKAEVIRLLMEERFSSAEIAERVGVSPPTVWAYKAHLTMGTYEPRKERDGLRNADRDEITGTVQSAYSSLNAQASPDEPRNVVMDRIRDFICKLPRETSITDSRILDIRQRYGRAYAPWCDEEDKLLLKLCKEKWSTSVLVEIFQRQPGAIASRIKKLKGDY